MQCSTCLVSYLFSSFRILRCRFNTSAVVHLLYGGALNSLYFRALDPAVTVVVQQTAQLFDPAFLQATKKRQLFLNSNRLGGRLAGHIAQLRHPGIAKTNFTGREAGLYTRHFLGILAAGAHCGVELVMAQRSVFKAGPAAISVAVHIRRGDVHDGGHWKSTAADFMLRRPSRFTGDHWYHLVLRAIR